MQKSSVILGIQLHLSSSPYLASEVATVKNSEYGWAKPHFGLWTSSYRSSTQDSEWLEWCTSEDFDEPQKKHKWLLTPRTDIRVAVIDSLADLTALLDGYELYLQHMITRNLDFEKLSQEYDAMHLTSEGQWRTRLSIPDNLYGWDCESTLWFRWCFTDSQLLTL